MKIIILISSIFYILGLKISNRIDFLKKSNPVEKIITNTIRVEDHVKLFHFNQSTEKADPDSIKNGTTNEELKMKNK
ncbi:MAG: hypothetical protein J7L95_08365 [Prolixibacteraceae bacterium]|nr:hypothetical protein [Prolixibacteraceae bacterium]